MKSSGSSTPMEDNINVVVRVRPVSEKEIKTRDESIAQFPGNGQILVSSILSVETSRTLTIRILIKCFSARVKMTCRSQSYSRITLFSSRARLKRIFCSTVALSG